MASIAERLSNLVMASGFRSRRAFAQAAGVNAITFNDNLAKGAEPRFSTLESILLTFPNVSAEWLMRGEGDIFRTVEQPAANVIHIDKSTRTVGGNGVAGDGNTTGADAILVEQLRKENAALQERVKEAGEQIRNKDAQIAKLLDLLAK